MRLEKLGKIKVAFPDYDEIDAMSIILKVLRKDAIKNDIDIMPTEYEHIDMFYEYKEYTLEEIALEIRKMLPSIESESLREKLENINIIKNYLSTLVMLGQVAINDVIGGSSTYTILPLYQVDSSYSRSYCNIKMASPERVLLIADTHIGDKEKEDFGLIDIIFSYASKKYNIKDAIHLGDVFHGIRLDKGTYLGYSYEDEIIQEILNSQIEKFRERFPDYMKVLAVEGNHDTSIIEYLERIRFLDCRLNQIYFSILKPNFHMLRRRENGNFIEGNGLRISLSHPLRYNMFYSFVKTYEVDQEDELSTFKNTNFNNEELLLSGHFHYSLSRSIEDDNNITRRIIEVVPSLSKAYSNNNDRSIAKILRFIYDKQGTIIGYGITPLYLFNNNVAEGREKIYQTNAELAKRRARVYQKIS